MCVFISHISCQRDAGLHSRFDVSPQSFHKVMTNVEQKSVEQEMYYDGPLRGPLHEDLFFCETKDLPNLRVAETMSMDIWPRQCYSLDEPIVYYIFSENLSF